MKHLIHRRVTFLFGSGISMPANMPSVLDLTKSLRNPGPIYRDTQENYRDGSDPNPRVGSTSEYVPRVLSFIDIILRNVRECLSDSGILSKDPNYEDIFEVVGVIAGFEAGNDEFFFIKPFVDQIRKESGSLCDTKDGENERWNLYKLATETVRFISFIIRRDLTRVKSDLAYLDKIFKVVEDNRIERSDIFTLNHDTLLDNYMSGKSVWFHDGFKDTGRGFHVWTPDSFYKSDARIVLYKLHGSIDWLRQPDRISGVNADGSRNVILENRPPSVIKISNPTMFWPSPEGHELSYLSALGQSSLVMGISMKLRSYLVFPFNHLQAMFHEALRSSKCVVISGYGFNDHGINMALYEWMRSCLDGKIVLIDPQPLAGFMLQLGFLYSGNEERIEYIQSGVENLDSDKIMARVLK